MHCLPRQPSQFAGAAVVLGTRATEALADRDPGRVFGVATP